MTITAVKTRAQYVEAGRALLAGRTTPCTERHAAASTCRNCNMSIPVGPYDPAEWTTFFGHHLAPLVEDPLEAAVKRANPPTKEHLKAEEDWRRKAAAVEKLNREIAVAFAESQDPSGRQSIVSDGGFFESVTARVVDAEERYRRLVRGREEVEDAVRRARVRLGEHEAALDQRRLVWRDQHGGEFR